MIINDLIKQLQALPEDVKKTHAWVNYSMPLYMIRDIELKGVELRTLTFDEAGKATRLLLAAFGRKPHSNFTTEANGHKLGFRRVVWYARSTRASSKLFGAEAALQDASIIDYKVVTGSWLVIHIPQDVYVSSFYASDDPKDWQKRNQRRIDLLRVKQVVKKLDGGKK